MVKKKTEETPKKPLVFNFGQSGAGVIFEILSAHRDEGDMANQYVCIFGTIGYYREKDENNLCVISIRIGDLLSMLLAWIEWKAILNKEGRPGAGMIEITDYVKVEDYDFTVSYPYGEEPKSEKPSYPCFGCIDWAVDMEGG